MTDDDKIYEFLLKKDDQSYLLVEPVIEFLCRTVFWECFRKMDSYLVKDAKSFATYKLLVSAPLTKKNLSGYLYSLIKRYYLDIKTKVIYTDDLNVFKSKYSFTPDTDFDDLKSNVIVNLDRLLEGATDENSKSVISNLIDIIGSDENELDNKVVSLYLLRTTGLHHTTLFNICKRLNLTLSISNKISLKKVFDLYIKKYGEQVNQGKIIEDWERKAIIEFGDHHERSRGKGYEFRNFRPAIKTESKTTKNERVCWLKVNAGLKPDELFFQYANKFGMSYTSFKSDRRTAKYLFENLN